MKINESTTITKGQQRGTKKGRLTKTNTKTKKIKPREGGGNPQEGRQTTHHQSVTSPVTRSDDSLLLYSAAVMQGSLLLLVLSPSTAVCCSAPPPRVRLPAHPLAFCYFSLLPFSPPTLFFGPSTGTFPSVSFAPPSCFSFLCSRRLSFASLSRWCHSLTNHSARASTLSYHSNGFWALGPHPPFSVLIPNAVVWYPHGSASARQSLALSSTFLPPNRFSHHHALRPMFVAIYAHNEARKSIVSVCAHRFPRCFGCSRPRRGTGCGPCFVHSCQLMRWRRTQTVVGRPEVCVDVCVQAPRPTPV